MNKEIQFKLPVYIWIHYKTKASKKAYLNMNGYRNWHHHLSNKLKQDFKELIYYDLNFKADYIESIIYQLYWTDKRKRDKMNYYSVIDKFFMDTLVEHGCITDDNDKFVGDVLCKKPIIDGEVEEPYCLVTINYK